ncbi:plant expansin [Suillus subluteus]|nr:plant expansin [Suillus subluteus]
MLVLSIFLLVSAILPFTIGDTHGRDKRGHHQELAQRARGDVGIHKRAFDNARFTFYDVGLGACGQYSSPGDFIVALNVAQYGGGFPGPQCFKSITISFGGKTAQATIMDECMGCPYGGLDFSIGLFSYFASEAAGVLYGSWWFDDGASEPAPSTSSAWTPTSTPDWSTPTPTHQYHPADTPSTTAQISTPSETATSTPSTTATSTASETPTSTPSTTNATATSTGTVTYPSNSTVSIYNTDIPHSTGAPIPVPIPDASHPENLENIGEALINLGTMLISCQRGN